MAASSSRLSAWRYSASHSKRALNSALAVALLLVGMAATTQAQDTLQDRSQRVKNLSTTERERLQRNFQQFQALSEAERERYRDLHQSLTTDQHSASLINVMNKYYGWLKTLTVTQRDELRRETNPQRRQELVRNFQEQQKRFRSQQSERMNQGPFAGGPQGLSREDLASVATVLEEKLKQGKLLSEAEVRELDRLQGVRKYRALIEKVRPRGNEPGGPVLGRIEKEPFSAVLAAISNTEQREHLQAISQPPKQRFELLHLMARGTLEQIRTDLERGDSTSLESLFAALDAKQRDEILKFPPLQQRYRLLELYRDQMMLQGGLGGFGGSDRRNGNLPDGPRGMRGGRGDDAPEREGKPRPERKPNGTRPGLPPPRPPFENPKPESEKPSF